MSKNILFIALTFSLAVIAVNIIILKNYTGIDLFICCCLYLLATDKL